MIWGKIKEFLEIYIPQNDFKSSYLLQDFISVLKKKIRVPEDEVKGDVDQFLLSPLESFFQYANNSGAYANLNPRHKETLEKIPSDIQDIRAKINSSQILDDILISGKNPMSNPYDHAVELYNKWLQRVPVTRKMEILKNKKDLPELIQELYEIKVKEGLMQATVVEEKGETEETQNSAD